MLQLVVNVHVTFPANASECTTSSVLLLLSICVKGKVHFFGN